MYENGKRQTITHFSQDNPPISNVIWLDLWSSAHSFSIPSIRATFSETLGRLRPEDEIALMANYCDKIFLMQDFTRDKQLIMRTAASGFKDGVPSMPPISTGVYALKHRTIYEAAVRLNRASNPAGRRAIIAVTDDYPLVTRRDTCDETKISPYRPGTNKRETRPKEEVFRQLFEKGIILSALIVPNESTRRAKRNLTILEKFGKLESLFRGYNSWDYADVEFYADRIGGDTILTDTDKAAAHLTELINRLYTRYSIGYVS